MSRRTYDSGTRWEPLVGYARAVQVGPHIHVSGTTATGPDGVVVAEGDPYGQMQQIIDNIRQALNELGAGLRHVVRTRIYVTDVNCWQEVGRAHAEAFAAVRPACTMVEVSRLIAPQILVEMEAEAYLEKAGSTLSPTDGMR